MRAVATLAILVLFLTQCDLQCVLGYCEQHQIAEAATPTSPDAPPCHGTDAQMPDSHSDKTNSPDHCEHEVIEAEGIVTAKAAIQRADTVTTVRQEIEHALIADRFEQPSLSAASFPFTPLRNTVLRV